MFFGVVLSIIRNNVCRRVLLILEMWRKERRKMSSNYVGSRVFFVGCLEYEGGIGVLELGFFVFLFWDICYRFLRFVFCI